MTRFCPRRSLHNFRPCTTTFALPRSSLRCHGSFSSIWLGRHFSHRSSVRNVGVNETPQNHTTIPVETLSSQKFLTPDAPVESDLDDTFRIKEHLRAWYAEREKQKTKEANEALENGIVTRTSLRRSLPDSLFMHEPETGEEDTGRDDERQDWEGDVGDPNAYPLEPGDVMYARLPGLRLQPILYLGKADYQDQFLLGSGQWAQMKPLAQNSDIIKNFASQEEVDLVRASLPKRNIEYMREGTTSQIPVMIDYFAPLPSSDGAESPLVGRLAQLEQQMIEFRRKYANLLDTMYDRLAHEEMYVHMDFDDCVQELLGDDAERLRNAARLAICGKAWKNPTKMHMYSTKSMYNHFMLMGPKSLVRRFEDVVKWTREYQEMAALKTKGRLDIARLSSNPVDAFIRKAQKIIKKSREVRAPTVIGCLGPSDSAARSNTKASLDTSAAPGAVTLRPSGEVFNDDDKAILDFIWDTHVRDPNPSRKTNHDAISSVILRAMGAYPEMVLEDKIGRLVLQEVGAMAPWASPEDDNVAFPIPGRKGAYRTRELTKAAEQATMALPKDPDSGHLRFQDSMSDLRENLGNMEVFVIDPRGTTLADDGISLEPCSDRPGWYWFHAHIAHPSAHFDHNSVFGRLAKTQQSSWYATNEVYSMVPEKVGAALSLRPGASALTTSILINEAGEMADVKIRPTRIHNIVKMTHHAVNMVTGVLSPHGQLSLIVGSSPKFDSDDGLATAAELNTATAHADKLKKLHTLLCTRGRLRIKTADAALNLPVRPTNEGAVQVSFAEKYDSARLHSSIHYVGDPTIKVSVDTHVDYMTPEQMLGGWMPVVSGAMLLAGEGAAKWMADRKMPGIYTGARTRLGDSINKLNRLSGQGATPIRVLHFAPVTIDSATPVPHVMLHMKEYMRFGSPLRRFQDLVNHWQVDAYLRAVAQGKIKDGEALDEENFKWPYSRSEIEKMIKSDRWVVQTGRNAQKSARSHWTIHAFFRAFHFGQAYLPKIFDFEMQRPLVRRRPSDPPDTAGYLGALHPFEMLASVLKTPEGWENQCRRGQFLPCKLERMDVTTATAWVRPVGPPSDHKQHVPEAGTIWQSAERWDVTAQKAKEQGATEEYNKARKMAMAAWEEKAQQEDRMAHRASNEKRTADATAARKRASGIRSSIKAKYGSG